MGRGFSGTRLTPKQMMEQWIDAPRRLGLNVWNFQNMIGDDVVEIFKESFDKQRFNASGSLPWKPRKDNKAHPILSETGTLKNSIKWKTVKKGWGGFSGVRVYTDPTAFGTAKRNKGVCYAAIHNAPSGTYTYGNTGVASVQRQFIGHSDVVERRLKFASFIIFEGFPK